MRHKAAQVGLITLLNALLASRPTRFLMRTRASLLLPCGGEARV